MKDLQVLIEKTKDTYLNTFEQSDFYLTEDFKQKYASYLRNNGQNIEFNDTTAIITTSGNLQIYAPNQWFLIASYVVEFLKELIVYKDTVEKILVVKNMSAKEKKEYITELKEGRSYEKKNELKELAGRYLGVGRERDISFIVKFLTDYSWWSGSKTIDRSDYYVSPILNLLGLVNVSQSYVADIAYIFASVPELSAVSNGNLVAVKKRNNLLDTKSFHIEPEESARKKGGQNLIIYGAPGTGKSRGLEDLLNSGIWNGQYCESFISNYSRVVFHTEYTYFDFVGTYKPVPVHKKTEYTFVNSVNGNETSLEPYINYEFVPGPFIELLVAAWLDKENMYTLLIEEINRANAAAVFGEIFQLLDRNKDGTSEYAYLPSKDLRAYLLSVEGMEKYIAEGIKIPSNMNIVATMNSADQGVNVLDSAFKRRWNYKYKKIDIGNAVHKDAPFKYAGMTMTWGIFVTALNEKLIKSRVEEDRLIGPYFIKPDEIGVVSAKDKLLLYLWDDVLRHQRTQFFATYILTFGDLTDKFSHEDVLELTLYLETNNFSGR